jgi:hypothetical protein
MANGIVLEGNLTDVAKLRAAKAYLAEVVKDLDTGVKKCSHCGAKKYNNRDSYMRAKDLEALQRKIIKHVEDLEAEQNFPSTEYDGFDATGCPTRERK